ncbi:MAG: FAD-dependent oxidoreductase [Roseburia sp.]|nr:FAD-dependent oxidoreductase [Roseburia sp.]
MDTKNLYDVIIVGGGPAGLSAAIYLGRAKYRVLVMEKEKFGGQITITAEIVNYPGVEKTSGTALTERMRLQAEAFGAEFVLAQAKELELEGDIKRIVTADGEEYQTVGILLALGASPRKLGFAGEKEFQGRGVAYCATCDGEFFTGREVLVVGGGFAAVEESMFLTKYAKKVTMLVITENFTCAAGVSEQLKKYPQIAVRFQTELIEAGGGSVVEYAKIRDNRTGEITEYRAEDGGNIGIFVFVGYAPATEIVRDKIVLNEQGYVVTNQNQATSIDGVYAAGDVCIKNLRQVVTAVADGAIAATSLEKHVSECRERLKLPKAQQQAASGRKAVEHETAGVWQQGGDFITAEMREQLLCVFDRFARRVVVKAWLNGTGASKELEGFARELEGMHERLAVVFETLEETQAPFLDVCTESGSSGIRYYSVPGGHEFNSFIIALYNAAGPGQKLGERVVERIKSIGDRHLLQVMATLSCTNCPEVVMATQKIASVSDTIEAEMYDLSKFPEIRDKYQIMAVPCLIIDKGEQVLFGKKGIEEILEAVEKG